jgi:uncharacterized membrane protein
MSWAATLGWLHLNGSWLAILALPVAPWILTTLALVELVTDQLLATPSRTVPIQFSTRAFTGTLAAAMIGTSTDTLSVSLNAGIVGVTLGTLGGRAARAGVASMFGQERPAALIEDAVAIIGAMLIVRAFA